MAIPIECTPPMIHRPSINESACVSFLYDAKYHRNLVVYQEDGLNISISLTEIKCKVTSCKKVVMWACCQRNTDHLCTECTIHAAHCRDCGGSVCHNTCFWGSDAGVNLCTMCGHYCVMCNRAFPMDEIFKCSTSPFCSVDEICLDCAEGVTEICGDCGNEYCDLCVADAGRRCESCNKYLCDSCKGTNVCEQCSVHYCYDCSEIELNPHPKWKYVHICIHCLVEYDHDIVP